MNITINNRRHSLSIVPIVSPDAPDSPIGIEARGDGKPPKLCIRAGMTPLETATAAAHLVSTMWRMKAGKSCDRYPRPGQVKIGRTRYQLVMAGRCESKSYLDPNRRTIHIEPTMPTKEVAERTAHACDTAWGLDRAMREMKSKRK